MSEAFLPCGHKQTSWEMDLQYWPDQVDVADWFRVELPRHCHDCAEEALFRNLKEQLPELERLLVELNNEWIYEDGIYRFYHQSFKVFGLQQHTVEIVEHLQALAPERKLHKWFRRTMEQGTGLQFSTADKHDQWLERTRPIVDAFFHAHYMLQMAVRYGRELKSPPKSLPCGWAAFLYLYCLR